MSKAQVSYERLSAMQSAWKLIGKWSPHEPDTWTAEISMDEIKAVVDECMRTRALLRELQPHAKWLRMAAAEIAEEGHAGWGNTCSQAADAIEACP